MTMGTQLHESETRYLIYSPYWSRGNDAVWWGPDGRGYVTDVAKAGQYTMAEAEKCFGRSGLGVWVAVVPRGEMLIPIDSLVNISRPMVLVGKCELNKLVEAQADSGRLDRSNALRERAGAGAITVEQAALFMGGGDEETVRLIKERVG